MRASGETYCYYIVIFVFLTFFTDSYSQNTGNTVIEGRVVDAKTGEPLTGTNVFFDNTTIGAITDSEGKYRIETSKLSDKVKFSFLGYETETRSVTKGIVQTININLKQSAISLNMVRVKSEKRTYKNKDNPAVELIQKVIANKDSNRKEKFDYLQYKQYEKIQFAMSNLTQKFKQKNLVGKFRFLFENIDTTKRIGKNVLPLYIKESISDHYYRKNPEATKEIIRAEKTNNLDEYLDNKGVSKSIDYLYQNINIYDNVIMFLTNKFVSPIANLAPDFYRYFIEDTLTVNDIRCIKLFFEPRNPADFLFHGYLYITLDGNFAVRKIDMGINQHINIDWVQDIAITQDFDQFGQKTWFLAKDEISIDFGIVKNSMGLFGQRTISYKDYKVDEPIADKIFRGPEKTEKLEPSQDKAGYWDTNRYAPLTRSERGTYTTIDSIKKVPEFKKRMRLITLFASDFLTYDKVEFGPFDSFYSYNSIERSRFRFGGRTTPGFSKKINFDGYLAYGLGDNILKYNAGITYSLTPRTIYQFPVKSLRLSYQKEVRIPGQEFQLSEEDNIFFSLKRGVNDKFLLNNTFRAEFLNEYENHFSYLLGFKYTRQSTEGNLHFISNDTLNVNNNIRNINVSELYVKLRYAPNESFYQGKLYRYPYRNKYPVIELECDAGSKLINNNYDYLRLQLDISKRFFLSVLGYGDITLEAGKLFGSVPYPLLFIHRANQTYSYQKNDYNLMNFLEFVSDQYASVNLDYSFNGFIFNKIPLLKKLKLRELITFKVLYGGLSRSNNPDYNNSLFQLPIDQNGVPLTYTLDKRPYFEAGVGLSNIFKILRVDLVKRFSYLNNPHVSDIGVRFLFRFDI
jgi:hypothetical protein